MLVYMLFIITQGSICPPKWISLDALATPHICLPLLLRLSRSVIPLWNEVSDSTGVVFICGGG